MQILIIEDDESWLEFCLTVLAKQGHQVSAASNALDALPKVREGAFDIVITDHVLPGPRGGSIADAVKAAAPATEVIVMTARPTIDDAVLALRSGAADYLAKPFTYERLSSAVECCRRRRKPAAQEAPAPHGSDILQEIVEGIFLRMLAQGGESRARAQLPGRLNPAWVEMFNRLLREFRDHAPAPAQTQPCLEHAARVTRSAGARLGRYEIVKELGRGAMGLVYLGRDPRINRFVAIKTLATRAPDPWGTTELKRRFFREAECAGKLDHPNIVKVFDAGEENGEAFIAMEFLEGGDLTPYTEPARLLPLKNTLGYAGQASGALHYAHRQGVIHRDVKPANMMIVDADKSLRITDFGIAGMVDAAETIAGVVGTPYYMSPERIAGARVDGRADQFSLGVVLFELLTGERPWRESSTVEAVLWEVANVPHKNIRILRPEIPEALAAIVDKTLSKSPQSRFADCGELAAALHAVPA